MSVYNVFVAGLSGAGLLLLGFVTTHGQSDYHKNAAQLEAQLQGAAQAALQTAGLTWAQVEMDGQRAILSGNPPSPEAGAQAEQIVLTSSGKGGPLWGGVIAVETAYGAGATLATVSPYVWRAVKTEDKRIVLVGSVPSETARAEIVASAGKVSGPDAVTDRMELAAGTPEGDWGAMTAFALEQLAMLDSGEARLTDAALSVTGVAMADAARIQVAAAVANVQTPFSGTSAIAGPSLWKAEHRDGALVLSGNCESPEDKAEIASIARTHFSGDVVDEMTVDATEYQNWVQGVRLGLPHFSKFKSGEMAFEPEVTGFSFDGEASASTLQFLAEDMAKLEGQYKVGIEAEAVAIDVAELAGVDLGTDPLIACQAAFDLVMQANSVIFETGSAVISRESGLTLDKIMAVAGTCAPKLRFEVAGHTDSSGDREANLVLSQARAQSVANYMAAAGFSGDRLIVAGYGPDQPAGDNATLEGRAANRRIEFNVQEWSE